MTELPKGWQPIETAKKLKDGTEILALDECGRRMVTLWQINGRYIGSDLDLEAGLKWVATGGGHWTVTSDYPRADFIGWMPIPQKADEIEAGAVYKSMTVEAGPYFKKILGE
jgi:hypothetical protein